MIGILVETAVIVAIVSLLGVIFTSFLGPFLLDRFKRKPQPAPAPPKRKTPRSAIK